MRLGRYLVSAPMSSMESGRLLIKIATPDLYRENAFRLTGLSVTASGREVARQADKLKMLAELGGQAAQQLAIIPGMEAPSADEIREAAQRLKDVEARALDEFFWFWPSDWEIPDNDAAFVAIKRHDLDTAFTIWAEREVETESLQDDFVASHNIALVLHMRAIEWSLIDWQEPLAPEREIKVQEYWKDAFERWQWLVADDGFWDCFKTRIRQINDPILTTGFARRLRQDLPQALAKIQVSLALGYAERGRSREAVWHLDFLRSRRWETEGLSTVLDTLLAPTREKVERACLAAREAAKTEPSTGMPQAIQLLDTVPPWLELFRIFYRTESVEYQQLSDGVAFAARISAIQGYNQSRQALENKPASKTPAPDPLPGVNAMFMEILMRARSLAYDPELCARLDDDIQGIKSSVELDTTLKPWLDKLLATRKMTAATSVQKLNYLKKEIIPSLDALLQSGRLNRESAKVLEEALAVILREIALEANNVHQLPLVGMDAISLAQRYARDPEMIRRLNKDFSTMSLNAVGRKATGGGTRIGDYLGMGFIGVILLIVFYNSIKSSGSSSKKPTQTPPAYLYDPVPQYSAPPLSLANPPPPIKTQQTLLDKDGWYSWTNQFSNQIMARMVSFDGETVMLETENGENYSYPLASLSKTSQAQAYMISGREMPALATTTTPAKPKLVMRPVPDTGVLKKPRTKNRATGPLTIRTRPGSGNFYVKLVKQFSNETTMVIFIRDGETAGDVDVPVGSYELRYASGRTWYGEDDLFGEETSYSKAASDFTFGDGEGYTVELYKQLNGNLQTHPVNKNNF